MLGVLACRPAIGVQALRPCKMLCTRCNSHHNAASQPVTGMRHSGQAGASVASRAAAQGAQKAACKHGCNRQDLSASMHTTQSASSPGAHTALAQGSSGAGGDSGGARCPLSAPRLLRAGGAHGQCWQGRHQRRQPVVCRRSQLSLSLGAGCGICVDNEANWPRLLRRLLLLLLLLLLLGARRGRTPLPGIALAWPRHHVCNCRRLGMGRLHFSTASPNAGRRGAASVAAAPAN